MALAFPSNPTTGQTYTYSDTTWAYNGRRWVKYIVSSNINVTPSVGGGSGSSGIVIIAYSTAYRPLTSISGGLSYDQPTRSGYRVYTFTGGTGSISW